MKNALVMIAFAVSWLSIQTGAVNFEATKQDTCLRKQLPKGERFRGRFVVSGKDENNFNLQVERPNDSRKKTNSFCY